MSRKLEKTIFLIRSRSDHRRSRRRHEDGQDATISGDVRDAVHRWRVGL